MTGQPPISAKMPFALHDHGACEANALEHAKQHLAARGARLTAVRLRTLEILLETHRAVGAYEILDRLVAAGFARQPPVAYRALEFLVQHGVAHRVQGLNAFAACLHPGHDHAPIFLICRECEKVAELPATGLRDTLGTIAGESGFVMERSTVELLGLCHICAARTQAEPGESALESRNG